MWTTSRVLSLIILVPGIFLIPGLLGANIDWILTNELVEINSFSVKSLNPCSIANL